MYSVFLVDDEHIVLEGIRNKIGWEDSNFKLVGEATDGELALSMIHDIKPDILITDIKMPFMDGLELAQNVKKIQPWIKIIILSGHDEFDYAKKAISIGVEDYILKPFTYEDLFETLKKVEVILDKERQQLSDLSRLQDELESNIRLRRNRFLTDLIYGNAEKNSIIEKSEELNINLFSRFYRVVISKIYTNIEDESKLQEYRSLLLEKTKNYFDCITFFLSQKNFITIVKGNTEKETEENSFSMAELIEYISESFSDCKVVTSIGNSTDHLSQLTNSFLLAKNVIDKIEFPKRNMIISTDDIKDDTDLLFLLEDKDPLLDRLKYAGQNEIDNIISEYLEIFKNAAGTFNVIASYFLVDVIVAISKLVENLGGDIKEIMPDVLHNSFIENAVKDKESFITEVRNLLIKVLSFRDTCKQTKYSDVIFKAKKFIEKNYADPNTCLAKVAEEVNLSPNHFSSVFSQECGITFIEYLTNIRIEQAKRLLKDSNMKGYDIAYEIGFSDPHYFSFIFKKTTGLSPREYKNSN